MPPPPGAAFSFPPPHSMSESGTRMPASTALMRLIRALRFRLSTATADKVGF